jgi:hypothetical protein
MGFFQWPRNMVEPQVPSHKDLPGAWGKSQVQEDSDGQSSSRKLEDL